MDLARTPLKEQGIKQKRKQLKQSLSQAKSYQAVADVFDVTLQPSQPITDVFKQWLPSVYAYSQTSEPAPLAQDHPVDKDQAGLGS